ncbi:MAG: hypothetical protein RL701_4042, partial [Pseudomonadota bacterium]
AGVDERTDVFALGVVLFECLGGRNPFEADSLYAILARISSGQSTPLKRLRPELPRSLISLVERAITADPAQRIPSVQALIDELLVHRAPTCTGGTVLERQADRPRFNTTVIVSIFIALTLSLGALEFWRSWRTLQPSASVEQRPNPKAVPSIVTPREAAQPVRDAERSNAPDSQPPTSLPVVQTSVANKQSSVLRKRTVASPRAEPAQAKPSHDPDSRAKQLGMSERNPFR